MANTVQQNTKTLAGKWKLAAYSVNTGYAFPEMIVFKEKNVYGIEGKEPDKHPILDGGWYEYDAEAQQLKINTANDAITTFAVDWYDNAFVLTSDDLGAVNYRRVE